MSPSRPPTPADPSPEAIRRYLSDTARGRLDALRAELDRKLAALEAALADPSQQEPLADLVISLARTATAEATLAAETSVVEAQAKADERNAGGDELRHALEAERVVSDGLRVELEQARRDLDEERVACAQRDREIEQRRVRIAELETTHAKERSASTQATDALQAELDEARQALAAGQTSLDTDQKALARLQGRVKELEAALEGERETRAARERELEETRKALDGNRRTADADYKKAEADRRTADSDRQSAATARQALEQRCAELERTASEASERAEAVTSQRDQLAAEREGLLRERTELQRALADAEARASGSVGDLQSLTAELDAARHAATMAEAQWEERVRAAERAHSDLQKAREDAEGRTTAAQADATRQLEAADERIRALESQVHALEADMAARPGEPADDIDMGSLLDSAPQGANPMRRSTRYGFATDIAVQLEGQENGVLVDLSVSGAQLLSATALPEGSRTTIVLLSDAVPVTCKGAIVWTRLDPHSQNRQLRYRAGILFSEVDQASLEAFIIMHAAT